MRDQFLIGELASLFQISTDTLRYYDKIELIKPDITGKNGYRYYSIRSFFKLSRILFLKDLDIPLEEIKGYMENKNTEKLVRMLHEKQMDLDYKIQSCLNLQAKINQKLELLESSMLSSNEVSIKSIPKRYALYMASSDFRAPHEIKSTLMAYSQYLKFSTWVTEGQIYTSVSQPHLRERNFSTFQYIFEIPHHESFSEQSVLASIPEGSDKLSVIEAGQYACMRFMGPYSEIDQHYNALLDWVERKGFVLCGDSIEMNIVDYDFSDSHDEFISELQVPVKLSAFK